MPKFKVFYFQMLFSGFLFSGEIEKVKLYLNIIPKTVEVTKLSTIYEATVSNHIAEGLFLISDGYEVEPNLVEKYTWNSDQTILEMNLKNKTFSNGESLNSKHVIESLIKCIRSPRNKTSHALSKVLGYKDILNGKLENIEGLIAVNDKALKILLKEPAPLLIDELAMGTCNIWTGTGDDLLTNAYGTGPYIIDSVDEKRILLKKRSDAKTKKIPEKIEFTSINDPELNDEFEFDLFVSDRKRKLENFQKYEMSQLISQHLTFNLTIKPFDNIKIRKLISESIDFKKLHSFFGVPKLRMQAGLVPFGIRGFKKRELKESDNQNLLSKYNSLGFSNENPLKIDLYIRDTVDGRSEKNLWKEIFKSLPVNLNLIFVPTSNLFNQKLNVKYPLMRVGKSAGAIDPFRLYSSYHTSSTWNLTHSNIVECDSLITRSIKVIDRDLRYKIYNKVDDCLIKKYQILVPLFTIKSSWVYLNKKWKLTRKNRFLLYPFRVYEWEKNE